MNESEEIISVRSNEVLLNELIDQYGDELKRVAFLYVNDVNQCEDIIQEVFISCYNNLNHFKNKSSYKTWLYRITINKCKDYLRRWSFRNIVYSPVMQVISRDSVESPQKIYEKSFESNEIINSLSSLSAKYKEVLILFYYQEMTLKEISEITHTKVNTVKSRLNRGRKLLKEELERRNDENE